GEAAGADDAPGARLLDNAPEQLRDVDQIGPRADRGIRHRHRAIPNRPRMELDHQAVYVDRGLLPRDLGQRLQPDGADWRLAQLGFRHFRGDSDLLAGHEPAGAAVRIRRVGFVART